MTNREAIEQLENAIELIKQDGKDWLDDRDIPILEACIKSLTALDKIRAEIEQLTSRYSISKERGGMGQVEWSDMLIKESDVLQIIDKYKAESDHKCHTCKHYLSGEQDGSCDSYICEHYSNWESEG